VIENIEFYLAIGLAKKFILVKPPTILQYITVFPYGTLQVILAPWTPAEAILLMKIWLTFSHIPDTCIK